MENLKKEIKKNKNFILIVFSYLIALIVNSFNFIYSSESSFWNCLISFAYIGIFFYLILEGKKNSDITFLGASTIYWIVLIIVGAIDYGIYMIGFTGELFAPFAVIFLSPIYHLGEFISPYGPFKLYILLGISFFMLILSYIYFRPLEIIKEKEELKEILESNKVKY